MEDQTVAFQTWLLKSYKDLDWLWTPVLTQAHKEKEGIRRSKLINSHSSSATFQVIMLGTKWRPCVSRDIFLFFKINLAELAMIQLLNHRLSCRRIGLEAVLRAPVGNRFLNKPTRDKQMFSCLPTLRPICLESIKLTQKEPRTLLAKTLAKQWKFFMAWSQPRMCHLSCQRSSFSIRTKAQGPFRLFFPNHHTCCYHSAKNRTRNKGEYEKIASVGIAYNFQLLIRYNPE